MKKIIFTVSNDISYDQRMQRICGSLSKNGYRVLLLGRKRKDSIPLNPDDIETQRLNCLFKTGPLFYAEYNFRLFIYLLFTACDIICAIDLDTILPVLLAAKLKKKKCVYDAHEYFTEVPELIGRNVTKKIWNRIASYCIPKMDKCYTVNDSLSEILSNKYHNVFGIVKNVPLLQPDFEKANKGEKYILYQGAVNAGRGLEELVLAMKSVAINLVIAGDGDITGKVRNLILENQLENKIKITGFLSPEGLLAYTRNAFIGYNLLNKSSESYYYSLSNKFFDYVHAEIPSLSNNFPEYRLVNEKFEVTLLCDLKVKEIIESINLLLEDYKLYNNLVSNCLEAKKVYNWQNEEKHLLDVYQNI